MVETINDLFDASAVLMFGRDETNENYIDLAAWPMREVNYTVNIDACERNYEPLYWAFHQLHAKSIKFERDTAMLKRLKQQFFPVLNFDGFIVVPGYVSDNNYPDLVFLVVADETCITNDIIILAEKFSNHCATINQLNANIDQSGFRETQLARSLAVASDTLKKQKDIEIERSSSDIIGSSQAIYQVKKNILKYGASNLSILIRGETGTGKELVAQSLHKVSFRAKGNFIAVNMASINPQLIESEFFGHVKGAFTGADKIRAGYFNRANGGTLFLDEIGDLPLDMQAKLLRVLDQKTYRPVGSDDEIACDVRIIAATHKNIEQMIIENLFREDLYYRLAEGKIILPPLRERSSDIIELIEYFLNLTINENADIFYLQSEAKNYLIHQSFPGNIRQLKTVINRACLSANEDMTVNLHMVKEAYLDIPYAVASSVNPMSIALLDGLQNGVDAFEKLVLLETIKRNGSLRSETAKKLKIPIRTFYNKLKKYGLEGTEDE